MDDLCLIQTLKKPLFQLTLKNSAYNILSSYKPISQNQQKRKFSKNVKNTTAEPLKTKSKPLTSVIQTNLNNLFSKKSNDNPETQLKILNKRKATSINTKACSNLMQVKKKTTSPIPSLSSSSVILSLPERELLVQKFKEEYEIRKNSIEEYRKTLIKLKREENNLSSELYQFTNPNLTFIHSENKGLPSELFQQRKLSALKYISPSTVFANNEVNMSKIDTYGFDYDYTLAQYSKVLAPHLYGMILTNLVKKMHYPKLILQCKFNPKFAVRGIHYDFNACLFFKLSSTFQIDRTSIHRGNKILSQDEVQEYFKNYHHGGSHVTQKYLDDNTYHLVDLFSIPELCVISDIIQIFIDNNIKFNSKVIYQDIRTVTSGLHQSGELHKRIINNIGTYLEKNPILFNYLKKLKKNKKKLFLLTNSPYSFINNGLNYIFQTKNSAEWRNLFDAIIVQSKKPSWYHSREPFQKYRLEKDKNGCEYTVPVFEEIKSIEPGVVYSGGNIKDFARLTGWQLNNNVLYFGDHLYSDLAGPTEEYGWKTGAIIRELTNEISVHNNIDYHCKLKWAFQIEELVRMAQRLNKIGNLDKLISKWKKERTEARYQLSILFNKEFGSIFKVHYSSTFFGQKIKKYADLYTSRLENFEPYSLDYVFNPIWYYLPNEIQSALFP